MAKSVGRAKKGATMPASVNPHGVQSVYVNNVQIASANMFDVRIMFNEVIIDEQNAITVERKANLVMSTSEFLAMMNMLNINVPTIQKNVQAQAEASNRAHAQIEASLGHRQLEAGK